MGGAGYGRKTQAPCGKGLSFKKRFFAQKEFLREELCAGAASCFKHGAEAVGKVAFNGPVGIGEVVMNADVGQNRVLDALRHVRMAVVGKRKQKARRKRVAVVLVHLHQSPDDGLNTRLIHAVGVGVKPWMRKTKG